MACQTKAKIYRQCLKNAAIGGGGISDCMHEAKILEACRESWRNEHNISHEFDGRRYLPNKSCQSLNKQVKRCMKWKQDDQSKCQEPILALKDCMDHEERVLAEPTESDKVWSDYKGPTPYAGRMVSSSEESCDY